MYLWVIATLLSYFVKGLCGFASSIVFGLVLGFRVPNSMITPVDCIYTLVSNSVMTWRNRQYVRLRVAIPCASILTAASIVGILFLKNTDAGIIKLVFGFVVIFMGIYLFVKDVRGESGRMNKVLETMCVVLAGVMTGLYGIGALMGVYISSRTETANEFRATMCSVFLAEGVIRTVIYAVTGLITRESVMMAIVLLPCMIVGLYAGIRCSEVIDTKLAKRIVLLTLIVSGIVLAVRSLLSII